MTVDIGNSGAFIPADWCFEPDPDVASTHDSVIRVIIGGSCKVEEGKVKAGSCGSIVLKFVASALISWYVFEVVWVNIEWCVHAEIGRILGITIEIDVACCGSTGIGIIVFFPGL